MSTELSSIQRRELVGKFLKMAFPPNGIGMGTAEMDNLGQAFKRKVSGQGARTVVTGFLKSVKANPSEATKGEMQRTLEAAFE